jgi:hypothetical protein
MAKKIAKQGSAVIYIQNSGKFTAAAAFERGQAGMTDITLPGPGARTVFYLTDEFGNPIPGGVERATPGQPGTSVENYVGYARDIMQKMADQGLKRNVQLRIHNCISLDHPAGWFPDGMLIHLGSVQTGDLTISAPAVREFGDARIGQSTPNVPIYHVWLVGQALTRLTTASVVDGNSIWFLSEPDNMADSGNGYRGPDKVGYIATDAAGGATADILYTVTGGGTWAATSADPFAADESVSHLAGYVLNKTQFRLICGRIITDAGAPAEIAYADITHGSEATTVWTAVNVGAVNGETISAVYWSTFQRLYVATSGGEIYLSTDQGQSFSTLLSGSTQVNAFHRAPNGNVYAVGASDLIYVEKGESGTFEALTGPAVATNSSVFVTEDAIWLGNGTAIYYTTNLLPAAAGAWTSVKDFGANHAVKGISCKGGARALGGDSQLVWLLVNDSSGNEGDVWFSVDGGGLFTEIANLTNSGYNQIYFSPRDPNLAFIVGEDNSSTLLIHKLAPAAGV